jgi:hypothetical protein
MINFGRYQIETDGESVRFDVVGHPRIKAVIVFGNSNVAVCGHDDQQIPEMQGALVELLERAERKELDDAALQELAYQYFGDMGRPQEDYDAYIQGYKDGAKSKEKEAC